MLTYLKTALQVDVIKNLEVIEKLEKNVIWQYYSEKENNILKIYQNV